jgi:hypothetical protein
MPYVNKFSGLIFLFFFSIISYSQEEGYKDLKIGSYLFAKNLTNVYKYSISKADSSQFRLKSILPQFICDEKVEFIDVKMNSDSSIEYIHLYTEEINLKDVDDYFNKYKAITGCIVNTIGKASYYEDGNNNPDGKMIMGWTLHNDKIALGLYTYSPSVFDKNVKRRYKFVWFKVSDPKKMW